MTHQNSIAISSDDLDFLLDGNWAAFNQLTKNCSCTYCSPDFNCTLTQYSIRLNESYDLELNGLCAASGHKITRYLEMSADEAFVGRAQALFSTRSVLLQSSIRKPVIAERSDNLSRKDKKILRQAIDKGLQKEYGNAIAQLHDIIGQWKEGTLDNRDAYLHLYQSLRRSDKQIAHRYDNQSGSEYIFIVAAQLRDGLVSAEDLQELSEDVLRRILFLQGL
ncbi:hypothetical protein V9K67_09330 [Paraflavisolibacter sp. H34]|uniref:hypothetical protein n=1 Tax=Huijunlia imazamoxiresistens TaxID=3127457 RepID=UPI003018C1B3